MKGRLTILVGISGSGKSTWAHKEWLKSPLTTLIVSRDTIRESMFGFSDKTLKHYFENENIFSLEREVGKMQDTMISEGLDKGKHVIVDDNHLTIGSIEQYKFWNVPTEVKVFEETLVQAILKDRGRVKQFGDEKIKEQYEMFKQLVNNPNFKRVVFIPTKIENDIRKPFAVLFDIDETLSHLNGRNPYDYKSVLEDSLDLAVSYIADTLARGMTLILTTARDGIAEGTTKRWLDAHKIRYDKLLMKEQGDTRPDWVVKEEMWRELAEDYYIVGCFEDFTSVIRRGRALGLKMFEVERNHY